MLRKKLHTRRGILLVIVTGGIVTGNYIPVSLFAIELKSFTSSQHKCGIVVETSSKIN